MMTTYTTEMPLDALVGELFGRASRRRSLAIAGWLLALGAHAGAVLLFTNHQSAPEAERVPPPVEVEFLTPPEAPPPPLPEPAEPAAVAAAAPGPPAAARAGALHVASVASAPAQQAEEAVDFTTDPLGANYGGGVVAVGGLAAFGAAGARVVPVGGNAPSAPVLAKPVGDVLTSASDLTRKPRLSASDPCRGFFPGGARADVGDVSVLVTVGKSGRVSNTQLLSESPNGEGFGAAARTCLASQSFVPALDRAGNSAATAIRVNLRFSR